MEVKMDIKAVNKLSYGLYVTGVDTANGLGGSVVDSVAQVSSGDPVRVVLGSMKKNFTTESIRNTGEFTLSVLGQNVDPFVIANFGFQSARDPAVDKWGNVGHFMRDGLPFLDGAISYMRLRVEDMKEYDTHTVFTGVVADAWLGDEVCAPLIYADYFTHMKNDVFAAFEKYKAGR
jgi:flavin reductase (DIM6/NTAB) family NADH-FMN oxidoreductase RutF